MHPDIEKLFDLKGKVAVVTGGGAGIGRAISRVLCQAGAAVAIADIDASRAQSAATTLTAEGGRATGYQADVSDEASVTKLMSQVGRDLGGIDILVNNAGIYPNAAITDVRVEDWDRVMAINVRGVMLCSRHALPAMRARGGGRIVNISSTESFRPTFTGLAHYGSSKGAVNTFTKDAALEFGPEVTVNAVCPGGTMTEGTSDAFAAGMGAAVEARTALKRVGKPEDIAAAVLFLASPASSYATGAILEVDGGLGMM